MRRASYFKGGAFLAATRRDGAHVILITKESLADAAWPRDAIDEFFTMPDPGREPDITYAVSYLARTRRIDRIVALDEYDTLTAAQLREHFRLIAICAGILFVSFVFSIWARYSVLSDRHEQLD